MRASRVFLLETIVASALIALGAMPLYAAGAQAAVAPAADQRAPTAVEEALAGYSCGPGVATTIDDAHYQCINDRIASLRARFGYDLGLLTKTERQTIDRTCGNLRTAEGRDAYIACVNKALVPLHVSKAPSEAPADPDASTAADSSATPSPAKPLVAWWVWLSVVLGAGVVAAGVFVVMPRIKAGRHRCRTCGSKAPPTGDLCADCRKHAAEALRQAAAERAERERAEQEEKVRIEQEARRLEQAELDARARHEEQERRYAIEREARQREEEMQRAATAAQVSFTPAPVDDNHDAFDPHAVLGVAPGADADAVHAAYQAARTKYDPEVVAHLGDEVQAHFRVKAEAVERAYELLSAAQQPV
jgi:DnaJ-domain-containing protein 1